MRHIHSKLASVDWPEITETMHEKGYALMH